MVSVWCTEGLGTFIKVYPDECCCVCSSALSGDAGKKIYLCPGWHGFICSKHAWVIQEIVKSDFREVIWLTRSQSLWSFGNNNLCAPVWSVCNGAVTNLWSMPPLCITPLPSGWSVPSVLSAHQFSGSQTNVKLDKSHITEVLRNTGLR